MEQTGASPGEAIRHSLFKGFLYYLGWWLFWGAVSGLVSVVDTSQVSFWPAKGFQVSVGLLRGALCGLLFTLAQNSFNTKRGRAVAWVLAIAIWVLSYFATMQLGALYQQAAARQITEAAMEKMRADGLQAHPNSAPSLAFQQEASAQITAKLRAEQDKAKQLDMAVDTFWGFLWINTRSRVDYCNRFGVDISRFKNAFEYAHQREIDKARSVDLVRGVDRESVYRLIQPSLYKAVEADMQDSARSMKLDAPATCRALSEHAGEVAARMQLQKMNPALDQALMGDATP